MRAATSSRWGSCSTSFWSGRSSSVSPIRRTSWIRSRRSTRTRSLVRSRGSIAALRDVLRRALGVGSRATIPLRRRDADGARRVPARAGDPGGTMQLTNLMRLLFDEKIGERTMQSLRSQVLGKSARTSRSTVRAGSPLRLVAAVGGAALGIISLLIAAPALRASPAQHAPEEPTTRRAPAPPVSDERLPSPTAAPAIAKSVDGSADVERANAALAANQPAVAVAAFEKAFAASPELREKYASNYAKALTEQGKEPIRERFGRRRTAFQRRGSGRSRVLRRTFLSRQDLHAQVGTRRGAARVPGSDPHQPQIGRRPVQSRLRVFFANGVTRTRASSTRRSSISSRRTWPTSFTTSRPATSR